MISCHVVNHTLLSPCTYDIVLPIQYTAHLRIRHTLIRKVICTNSEHVQEQQVHVQVHVLTLSYHFRISRGLARVKIEGGEGTVPANNQIQTWDGILSGGERLLTMSCSDKIAKWNVLGLQGSLLSLYIEPVYLKSIVIGNLFNQDHITRALHSRVNSVPTLPPSYLVNYPLLLHVTNPPKRSITKSSNVSLNWSWGDANVEIVNSRNGKADKDSSRLCKNSFVTHFLSLWDTLIGEKISKVAAVYVVKKEISKEKGSANNFTAEALRRTFTYDQLKKFAKDYCAAKDILNTHFQEKLGSKWIGKPEEQDRFTLQ